ncbi:cold-shock protein [Pseudomonas paralactis]|uniref:Cold-shock protein n=2 Tax=Pseudomonas paralactis TaxID=1615673 RepID=A0A0R3AQ32_9PSED|nr:cold shock domain-containing protein [Pseudomonas paralactis]KRP75391.1 cold-shock protein [Pseudomonas paralactis]
MTTGTVKLFNDDQGFGYITRDDDGTDIWAHFKEIQTDGFKYLVEGQRVRFEVEQGPKFLLAKRIFPIL